LGCGAASDRREFVWGLGQNGHLRELDFDYQKKKDLHWRLEKNAKKNSLLVRMVLLQEINEKNSVTASAIKRKHGDGV